MKDVRLNLRLNSKLVEEARRLAKRRGVTLTFLIEHGLDCLVESDKDLRRVLKKQEVEDAEQI